MQMTDEQKQYIKDQLNKEISLIPEHMHDSVRGYVLDRLEPGNFLYSVLSNDLKGAVGSADATNKRHLVEWVQYCTWYLPAICWGSRDKVESWLNPDVKEEE